jgi:hypothetical protein
LSSPPPLGGSRVQLLTQVSLLNWLSRILAMSSVGGSSQLTQDRLPPALNLLYATR